MQRAKAADAKDLIEFFSEFKKGNSERLDQLKLSGNDGQRKVETLSAYMIECYNGTQIDELIKGHGYIRNG
jgi:hypothetical protein